jgi:hypothetical protein
LWPEFGQLVNGGLKPVLIPFDGSHARYMSFCNGAACLYIPRQAGCCGCHLGDLTDNSRNVSPLNPGTQKVTLGGLLVLGKQAATALHSAALERSTLHDLFLAAGASAQPERRPVLVGASFLNDQEPTEDLSE